VARQEGFGGLSAKARAPLQAPPPPAFELPARRAESPIGGAPAPAPAAIPQVVAPTPPPPRAAVVPREGERLQVGGGSADDLFSGAATAYANGEHEAAVRGFGEFLAQHGGDRRATEARYFLASAYLALGRFAEAGAEFDTFLRQNPSHRRTPAALYRQAEARLGAGDADACQSLRSALDRYPQEREAATAKRLLAERCQ
jgi:TolA-binding protein